MPLRFQRPAALKRKKRERAHALAKIHDHGLSATEVAIGVRLPRQIVEDVLNGRSKDGAVRRAITDWLDESLWRGLLPSRFYPKATEGQKPA